MYYTIRVSTDQVISVDEFASRDLDLSYLQKSVHGYIEIVKSYGIYQDQFRGVLMIVDEEGLLKSDPRMNAIGTLIYGSLIVGDIILCTDYNPDPHAEPDCYAFDQISKDRVLSLIEKLKKVM